jgi:diacylglycerol kinase (ATP)
MRKRIRFIVNPFSGLGKQHTLRHLIEERLDPAIWQWQITPTKHAGHATEISRESVGKYDIVVAVGGDGTVNEVASGLVNTDTVMAIIPAGSGNGLARHLNIPLKVSRAIQMLNQCEVMTIDALRVNDRYSFNVSGVGFDGHISHLFAQIKKRGPLGYIKLITQEFPKYKSQTYTVTVDGKKIVRDAFLISFANSTQYGNNAHIAPAAKIDDGLCDVCIIRDFPIMEAPALLISLFDQTIDQTKFDEIFLGKEITVTSNQPLELHLDGDPIDAGDKVEISMLPLSLKVLVPTADFHKNQVMAQIQEIVPTLTAMARRRGF